MAQITVVITILNEQGTLPELFNALETQSRKPDEVIIVDGGSTDSSQELLANWKPKFSFKWIVAKGNRSVGRNTGIQRSKSEIIAITDAGCRPSKDWLKYLVRPLESGLCEVVAGYYKPVSHTAFEQAASCYMLVMPESVSPESFLPATRSMALLKTTWKKVGKFPERLSHNEDYVFSNAVKKAQAKIIFVREAVVSWYPPKDWGSFLKQVGRFAYGDMESGIVRPKVLTIFLRWTLLLAILMFRFQLFVALLALYCFWAYMKNSKHVQSLSAVRILPLMQVSTDFVVMGSSLAGFWKRLHEKKH